MKVTVQTLRHGFTLIELMVVIVIISILVGAFSYSVSSAQRTARIAKATAESRELGNAIRVFALTQDASFSELGLSGGVQDIPANLTSLLTMPSERNKNTTYFQVSESAIRSGRVVDPWGRPYKIRAKKLTVTPTQEDDYRTVFPLEGRHRTLKPMTTAAE